ncbi:hypothetical protein [Luteimonas sp. MC1825]|uniref:hypothetical protein n=1 Tax=Luteimonas sp. MC1825 TaxID=2761107 RepID=UPI00161106BB|nr:hypothetical protein [Luteimonas sp. MC1825]MBB6600000.1 hypothetical protein [Luteimonas sp. MC1825]QOC87703.1 hypothetical protein IDM46_10735 [Luteimonas sp. MC1825]
MSTHGHQAIGGYFASERGAGSGLEALRGAARYQSARSAIVALFRAVGATVAWVPHHVCGAVIDALDAVAVEVRRYHLTDTRGVPDDLPLGPLDWLVCIDYFGMSGNSCTAAVARHGGHRILIDASQALFHPPGSDVSTVYSPRKFVGVPDGGLLVTPHRLPLADPADEAGSIERGRYLSTRAAGDVAAGYQQFQQAEATLADCTPRGMSASTAGMLSIIDFDRVRRQRRANFTSLAAMLHSRGFVVPELPRDAVPLCCPVFGVEAPDLRRALASRAIFAPAYWPDAVPPSHDTVGLALRDRTLYLPCDHRYGEAHMEHVVDALLEIGKQHEHRR